MQSKRIDLGGGSRDLISDLPDPLCFHILSFLPTKETASTSVLSKRWNNLLAFVPNLEFDNSVYMHPRGNKRKARKRFMAFVDSVLALQGNAPLKTFKLKCKEAVDPYRMFGWVPIVLKRGVLNLDLDIPSSWGCYYSGSEFYTLPSEIFMNKTLVRLKIRVKDCVSIDVEEEDDVSLPMLKTLHLDNVYIEDNTFAKLLSGCPQLEESVLINLAWNSSELFSMYSRTLKRLTFRRFTDYDEISDDMAFDFPNLVYLECYDTIADEYPIVCFDSLVEANLGIRMVPDQIERIRFAEDVEAETDGKMVIGDVSNFLNGVRNVKILYLSDDTLHVLNYCCETVPMFDNVVHLTIKTHEDVGWKSLPYLLENSPILETLIFEGLSHKCMVICEDEYECLCNSWVEGGERDVPTCLSSSPVKVLKIQMVFDENDDFETRNGDIEAQLDQVKYFLETMPNLEQMILSGLPDDEDVIKVSRQLQMFPKLASPKCKIQVMSNNLRLSSTPSTKWGPLRYKTDPDFSDMDASPATSLSSL